MFEPTSHYYSLLMAAAAIIGYLRPRRGSPGNTGRSGRRKVAWAHNPRPASDCRILFCSIRDQAASEAVLKRPVMLTVYWKFWPCGAGGIPIGFEDDADYATLRIYAATDDIVPDPDGFPASEPNVRRSSL